MASITPAGKIKPLDSVPDTASVELFQSFHPTTARSDAYSLDHRERSGTPDVGLQNLRLTL